MSTKIEWTNRPGTTGEVWNCVTGCSHVSPGCEACYAERISARFGFTTKPWTAQNAAENVVLHPERLDLPLRWKKPRTVFVNSMSDLFHELVPDVFVEDAFLRMSLARQHTFIVLSKRPDRMLSFVQKWRPNPLPNVWLGVSVEDQRRADERIPLLKDTPAAVRFLSCEPLLGPIDFRIDTEVGPDLWLSDYDGDGIHWVIVGGESGPGARSCRVEWIRSLVEQCQAAHVPVFVKQDYGPRPGQQGRIPNSLWIKQWPEVRA